MAEPGAIPYNMGSLWREAGIYSFRLTAGATPAINKDNAALLNTTVTDTGNGIIDITFREAWLEIYVVGAKYIGTTDDVIVRIDAKTEGTSPALTIRTEIAGTADT